MTLPTVPLGLEAKFYRNTASYAEPTWNEITHVKDLTLNLEKGETDISVRNTTWRLRRGTLKDANIEFTLQDNKTNSDAQADIDAFRDAFLNNTSIECLVLDGPLTESGAEGLRASMEVFNFTRNENLEEALMYNVTIRPTESSNNPAWADVS